jgi:hypothetical protein
MPQQIQLTANAACSAHWKTLERAGAQPPRARPVSNRTAKRAQRLMPQKKRARRGATAEGHVHFGEAAPGRAGLRRRGAQAGVRSRPMLQCRVTVHGPRAPNAPRELARCLQPIDQSARQSLCAHWRRDSAGKVQNSRAKEQKLDASNPKVELHAAMPWPEPPVARTGVNSTHRISCRGNSVFSAVEISGESCMAFPILRSVPCVALALVIIAVTLRTMNS